MFLACLVQGRYPGLAIISVLIRYKTNYMRITETSCLLTRHNNNRLPFDILKTGGCKPARKIQEGCGSTKRGGGGLYFCFGYLYIATYKTRKEFAILYTIQHLGITTIVLLPISNL